MYLGGVDGCVEFSGDVAVGAASPAVLAGGVIVGVTSRPLLERRPQPLLGWRPWPTLLGVSPLEWHPWLLLKGSPSKWHPRQLLGVVSAAVVGVASLANLAGGVTVGVASPAVAGVADAGAASLADAGVATWLAVLLAE